MSYMEPFLIFFVALIIVACYFKILYEWHRKVIIHTIKPLKHHITQKNVKSSNNNNNNIINNNKNSTIIDTAVFDTSETTITKLQQAPGPVPWPVLGSLALLGQYKIPFEGFTELSKKYGDVFSMTLGSTRCVIVNNLETIREVLNQNGKFFGGRPDFLRFHTLFGGDRNNSLALCDWSNLQQKRRNLARKHCSPRDASSYYSKMNDIGCFEMQDLIERIDAIAAPNKDIDVKPLVMATCANMFTQYMCSIRFDYEEDKEFREVVRCFDEIFWEINQGYAVDFLPWLAPFYSKHMNKLSTWSSKIRQFILQRIINQRELILNDDDIENDFTDALLKSLREDPTVTRDTIIFMLEDFLGGHSAIGNLVMLVLGYIVKNPEVGIEIKNEIDHITEYGRRQISLYDTEAMPYTMATIFEVLRHSSSPIVPHAATEDTCIAGFGVTKGTTVFINNYSLNTSSKYWDEPEKFDPRRFLEQVNQIVPESAISDDNNNNEEYLKSKVKKSITRVKKNIPHFLPFSIGKRTCIGQNLVRGFTFMMIANIIQKYTVSCSDLNNIKMTPACVAIPADGYKLAFQKRSD